MAPGNSSSPPSSVSSTTVRMIESDLESLKKYKASKEWTEAKLDSLEKSGDETREIALSAKKTAEKPHGCLHEEDLTVLKEAVNGWKNLRFGGLIAFLVVVAGAIAQFYALADKAGDNAESMVEVKSSVKKIDGDVYEVKQAVKKHIDESKRVDKEEEKEKEQLLKDISDVVKKEMKNSRRGR